GVLGLDISDAMVELAQARVPEAEFRVGSFVSTELPGCVAVTAIGEVFNYLFDSKNNEHARERLFARIYEALEPGGMFLFDVATPERAKPGPPQRTFAEGPDWAVLVEFSVEAGVL